MLNKEVLTKHIKNYENQQLTARIIDKAESVLKNYTVCYTDFYDPYQIALGTSVLDNIPDIKYLVTGGYKKAERQIIIIYPAFMESKEVDIPMIILNIQGRFAKQDLTHRDFLGAILGLGLKREKVGDILVGEGQANIVIFEELWDYIQFNLDKVSNYKVNIQKITTEDMIEVEENFKRIQATAPSLRLDVIVSIGFGESRNTLSKLIKNDNVKVNWQPINQSSYIVSEGDVISFRGKGRIILEQIGAKTKKDRYKITVKKLI
ncbi:YlmH/Sll1252 family protein [Clostridiaceae bacterium 35-E11]